MEGSEGVKIENIAFKQISVLRDTSVWYASGLSLCKVTLENMRRFGKGGMRESSSGATEVDLSFATSRCICGPRT